MGFYIGSTKIEVKPKELRFNQPQTRLISDYSLVKPQAASACTHTSGTGAGTDFQHRSNTTHSLNTTHFIRDHLDAYACGAQVYVGGSIRIAPRLASEGGVTAPGRPDADCRARRRAPPALPATSH
ncbi:hypothetical protein EVAR_9286_1 [Eumeta japonica]|uniref:Uncharacterized protein n=1 Tax=Eumeta variegata TaxID=151549 RepID=A0A4C1TNT8_EUMVA|nr:hypothetical protein EVAR_9286_1 [Eumeta japonica]